MRARRIRALLAVSVTCLAAVAAADPPPRLVRFEARVLWDGPERAMPEDLREALADTKRLLARPLPRLRSAKSSSPFLRAAWRPWIEEHVTNARELLGGARSGDRDELVRTVLAARLLEHAIDELAAMSPPPALQADAELARVFREQIGQSLEPVRRTTVDAFRRCAALDPARLAPVLHEWLAVCGERAAAHASALELLARTRSAAPRPAPRSAPAPETPVECRGAGPIRDPDAPPPDESAPRQIAIVLEDEAVVGPDRARVIDALAARVQRVHRRAPVLPTAEIVRAERLVAERRVDEAGPVCGQPPPIGAVLARRFPNLVVAHARPWTWEDTCSLSVWFDRAGTEDQGGVPQAISIDLPGGCHGAATWMAAARRLRVGGSRMGGIIGGLTLGEARADAAGYEDDDPWLRIGSTLRAAERDWTACLPAAGAASFALSWTVTATGGVASPRARLLGPSTRAAEAARQCVERTLGRLAFPCTPSGQDQAVEARVCVARSP